MALSGLFKENDDMCMSLPYSGPGKGALALLRQLPGFLLMLATLVGRGLWLRLRGRAA